MKGVVLILLLTAVFQSSSLAGPVNTLQLTIQTEIQSQAVERAPLEEPQQNVGLRLTRAIPVAPKTPDRICAGCFSVIGDPTKPQQ